MLSQNLIHRAVLLTALLALLVPIAWIEHDILIQTHGTIAYPLDDAFFNLTLAKNLAFEHVWGITKYSFTSISTSLLYPFVLGFIYLVSGTSLVVPLLVNGVAAIWFIKVLHNWLIRQNISPIGQLLILLAVIYLTPLPALVISGMEYPLELLFTFLFLSNLVEINRKTYVYAILMLTSSYETLPVLLVVCILLLVRRGWWEAVKLLFISVLPLYLFGLLSITHHNYFVPNPLVISRGFPPLSANPYYPGFLIGCAIAFGGAWIAKSRNKWVIYPIPVLLGLPLMIRSVSTFRQTAPACIDVYTEQYQTAKFVYDFYYRDPVASNDLGAISFWADDASIADLSGIADLKVLNRRRINNWTPAAADSLSEQMDANVAILHGSWTDKDTDPYWYKIASWQVRGDSISFYSIDRRFIQKLETNMHAFESKLPAGVIVHYYKAVVE